MLRGPDYSKTQRVTAAIGCSLILIAAGIAYIIVPIEPGWKNDLACAVAILFGSVGIFFSLRLRKSNEPTEF